VVIYSNNFVSKPLVTDKPLYQSCYFLEVTVAFICFILGMLPTYSIDKIVCSPYFNEINIHEYPCYQKLSGMSELVSSIKSLLLKNQENFLELLLLLSKSSIKEVSIGPK
jgi:hypothetical protein